MEMPNNLILVRHGQTGTKSNDAFRTPSQPTISYYDNDSTSLMTTPGDGWKLTDLGKRQAQNLGKWLNYKALGLASDYHNFYVAPSIRTQEAAVNLNLPGAEWKINRMLRERDWGKIGSMSRAEFMELYPREARDKALDPLYWRPPNGESIADLFEGRARIAFNKICQESAGRNVVVVAHEEILWAFRLVIEGWDDNIFFNHYADHENRVNSCLAIHYTRINPTVDEYEEVSDRLSWVRRVHSVSEDERSRTEETSWEQFHEPTFSNEDLTTRIAE